jgi:hypothetical protein
MEQMVWAMLGLHPEILRLEEDYQKMRSRYSPLQLLPLMLPFNHSFLSFLHPP